MEVVVGAMREQARVYSISAGSDRNRLILILYGIKHFLLIISHHKSIVKSKEKFLLVMMHEQLIKESISSCKSMASTKMLNVKIIKK
jgi:hypothetical protein